MFRFLLLILVAISSVSCWKGKCIYNGQERDGIFFIECNICVCLENGQALCTTKQCDYRQVSTCIYEEISVIVRTKIWFTKLEKNSESAVAFVIVKLMAFLIVQRTAVNAHTKDKHTKLDKNLKTIAMNVNVLQSVRGEPASRCASIMENPTTTETCLLHETNVIFAFVIMALLIVRDVLVIIRLNGTEEKTYF
ncbi:chordin isoform X2 [Octopus vulgaris]|uniref:Chordin isoform X2 n=1 Tax=Octopus vulgaris TaxID=6645 RepID=A0AA36ATF5_OCTVU|nr:chordin isoform X2 [Octopus vulgaris]